jgi:O-antigen/teichoic acid export membrane protein
MFAVQLTTSAFTAVLTLYLVRALGPHGYGLFALALAVGGLAMFPSDVGISGSASRFVAEHRDDRVTVARVLADALRLKILAAGATSIALFALAGPIASAYGESGLTWPLRGIAVSLFGESVLLLVAGSFVALGKVAWNLRVTFVESLLEVTASIAFVIAGVGAAGAAFGRAVGYLCGVGFGVALIFWLLGHSLGGRRARTEGPAVLKTDGKTRQILRYAVPLAISDASWTLFTKIDAILIGALLTATAVSFFSAPMRLITFLYYPAYSVAGGVAPTLARRAGEQPDSRPFVQASRYVLLFQAALVAPLLVWAHPITDLLLGPGYSKAATVLQALTPYVFLQGIAPLVAMGATYLGEGRRQMPIAVATVLINFVLDLILLPRIGVVGAAIGTDVAFALYVPAQFLICRRRLRFPIRPLVSSVLRGAAAAAAMAAVLAAVGFRDLTLAEWFVGGIAGSCAFAAVLVLTREISAGELRVAWGLLMRRPAGQAES